MAKSNEKAPAQTSPTTDSPAAAAVVDAPTTEQAASAEAPEAPKRRVRDTSLSRGAKLLLAKRSKEAEQARREHQLDAEQNAHFLKCPRIATHHAAYLTKPYEKGRLIEPGDWFSVLKPDDVEVWTRPYIPCQECFLEGDERPWSPHVTPHRLDTGSFAFRPSAKLEYVVGKCSRDDLEERINKLNNTAPEAS